MPRGPERPRNPDVRISSSWEGTALGLLCILGLPHYTPGRPVQGVPIVTWRSVTCYARGAV